MSNTLFDKVWDSHVVKKIKNDKYRLLILLMTGLGGLVILLQ